MGVDEGEHFLHNRDTSVATLRGPFAFGSERQGSTLASRLSDTQNCEGHHASRHCREGARTGGCIRADDDPRGVREAYATSFGFGSVTRRSGYTPISNCATG